MTTLENKNIVLLVLDTVSAFNTPFTDYERNTMPYLSELAEDNVSCEFAYSNAPWTVPAHASMFTGKLPSEHDTTTKNMELEENKLAKSLSEKGYSTSAYSMNELICSELGFDQGFDKLLVKNELVLENSLGEESYTAWNDIRDNDYSSSLEKYSDFLKLSVARKEFGSIYKGFESIIQRAKGNHVAEVPPTYDDRGAGDINDLIIRDFQNKGKSSLFVFANYIEAHGFNVPPNAERKFISEDDAEEPGRIVDTSEGFPDLDSSGVEKVRRIYDTEISYLDQKLEELIGHLSGEYEDTVFIVTSDHGQNLDHYDGVWGHQFGIWERLIRVPLIIAGEDIPDLNIEENVPLRALYDLILGNKEVEDLGREDVFAEYSGVKALREYEEEQDEDYLKNQRFYVENESKAIIKGREGYIKNTDISDFVFNPGKSFSEKSLELEGQEYIRERLEEKLNSMQTQKTNKDEKIKDKLSELGYI